MFVLSKVSRCRDVMCREPNNADIVLNRLMTKATRTNDLRLKANCSRTLKNLASEADDGLEEGEVASLILSSLEVIYYSCLLLIRYDLCSNFFIATGQVEHDPRRCVRPRCRHQLYLRLCQQHRLAPEPTTD